MAETLTCPRCEFEATRLEFRKLDNVDMLHNTDVYRCPECGHFFAPVPEPLVEAYQRDVLRVKIL